MLSEALESIMSNDNLQDEIKECLITETLSNINDTSPVATLKLGLSWVLEGDRTMVIKMGWLVMDHLKQLQDTIIPAVLNSSMLEDLLKLENFAYNTAEVPPVIAWWLSINSSPDMEEVVRYNITHFLREANGEAKVLESVSKFLCEFPNCIPRGNDRIQFCTVLVTSIASLPVPRADPVQVGLLVKQMGHVESLLLKVWEGSGKENTEELVFRSLAALHSSLVDCPTDPCPALAAVLQLVNPLLITKAVKAILRTDQAHSHTFRTLCEWMLYWPRAPRLKPWVLVMMDGLEAERQFDVLLEVTLATVDRLFMALQLPAVRPGISFILYRMFSSTRHTPQVFLKVVSKIPQVIKRLLNEKSDSSHSCLQMIVNLCHAMMNAFPRTDNLYDSILNVLQDCRAFLPPGEFAPENTANWCNEGELEVLTSFKSKGRSSTNHVGLNNLGNTCYMNSVLQALFMTKRFCTIVLESDIQGQPLLCELQALFALLLHSRRQAVSPLTFLAVARPPGFVPGHQQDSSEFLTYLLDVLHEQEKFTTPSTDSVMMGGAGDEKTEGDSDSRGSGAMTRWTTEEDLSNQNILQRKARSLADFTQATGDDVQNLSNSHSDSTDSGIQSVCGDENAVTASSPVPYESVVQQVFGGCLLTSFKCLHCQAESIHMDHFRDIQLAFPPGCSPNQEITTQEMLDYFVSPEHLSGENQYRCDSCGGLRDAQRSIRILQFPTHLVLTLKRFQFNSKTGQRAKLLHRVECSENIQLHHQPYKLYAAVVHSGSSMDTGHYYTLARNQNVTWHIFNDSTVNPCNPPPWNIPDTPYILFYARAEEQLQPPIDLENLPPLRPHLMELIQHDHIKWLQDLQGEEENHRKRRKQQSLSLNSSYNHDKDGNGGGGPPGSCGGCALLPQNRFVF